MYVLKDSFPKEIQLKLQGLKENCKCLHRAVKDGFSKKILSYLLLFNKEGINKTSLVIFVQVFEVLNKSNSYKIMEFISVSKESLVSP